MQTSQVVATGYSSAIFLAVQWPSALYHIAADVASGVHALRTSLVTSSDEHCSQEMRVMLYKVMWYVDATSAIYIYYSHKLVASMFVYARLHRSTIFYNHKVELVLVSSQQGF